MLDLENAIAALRGDHPEAASVVLLHRVGFTRADLSYIRNHDRLLEKGKAWLLAYLSGEDPEGAPDIPPSADLHRGGRAHVAK